MIKKPDLGEAVKDLDIYRDNLQGEYNDLDEKQAEEESETRQEKIDELQARIDLVEIAIDALESVE